jgi:hypothetical protein
VDGAGISPSFLNFFFFRVPIGEEGGAEEAVRLFPLRSIPVPRLDFAGGLRFISLVSGWPSCDSGRPRASPPPSSAALGLGALVSPAAVCFPRPARSSASAGGSTCEIRPLRRVFFPDPLPNACSVTPAAGEFLLLAFFVCVCGLLLLIRVFGLRVFLPHFGLVVRVRPPLLLLRGN